MYWAGLMLTSPNQAFDYIIVSKENIFGRLGEARAPLDPFGRPCLCMASVFNNQKRYFK